MSLNFTGNTHKVELGTNSVLNDLDPMTVCAWVYTNAATVNGAKIYIKGVGVGQEFSFDPTTLLITTIRATTIAHANALLSNFAAYANTKWVFIAGVVDTGTAGNNKLYVGDLSTLAAEPSAYAFQQAGSGAVSSNAGSNATIGNRTSNNRNYDGRIASIGVWNRGLTQGEIREQQFRPHKTSGCVLFMQLGFNGTGTQPDWSGNANAGTVTGAAVAAHVPLGPFIGYDKYHLPSAAGGATPLTQSASDDANNLAEALALIYGHNLNLIGNG